MSNPRPHVVAPGDCLASLAATYGVCQRDLVDHPDNAELLGKRSSANILEPGDIVYVPEPLAPNLTCNARQTNSYVGEPRRVELNLQLSDPGGQAIAGKKFRLTFGEETIEGTTDGEGAVSERVPARATIGELELLDDEGNVVRVTTLRLGHLDPPETAKGTRGRLDNLGFRETDLAGSLRAFQQAEGLEATGEADDDTIQRLRDRHGS